MHTSASRRKQFSVHRQSRLILHYKCQETWTKILMVLILLLLTVSSSLLLLLQICNDWKKSRCRQQRKQYWPPNHRMHRAIPKGSVIAFFSSRKILNETDSHISYSSLAFPSLHWPAANKIQGADARGYMPYSRGRTTVWFLYPTRAVCPAHTHSSWHEGTTDLVISIPWKDSFLFPCQLSKRIHCLKLLPELFHLKHRRCSVKLN